MAAAKRSRVKLLSRPTAYSDRRTRAPLKRNAGRAGPSRRGIPRASGEPSLGRPYRPRRRREPLRLQKITDHEGHFYRLLSVEARIAKGVVAVMQIRFRDDARPAGALGDVLAGHLEMDSAGVDALGARGGEEVA